MNQTWLEELHRRNTGYVESSRGILSYSQLAPVLAERVLVCKEAIVADLSLGLLSRTAAQFIACQPPLQNLGKMFGDGEFDRRCRHRARNDRGRQR